MALAAFLSEGVSTGRIGAFADEVRIKLNKLGLQAMVMKDGFKGEEYFLF